ncbi:MAG TPA: hypothetical protein VF163_07800 [Micromonosporaceae bacterium]
MDAVGGRMALMHPLVPEAMKKAAIAWLGVGDQPAFPVWCLWIDDSLYVVSGPGEQPAPGLAAAGEAGDVTVTARGDHGGRIVTWAAKVERVPPDSDTWREVVPQLAGKRLNSTGAEDLGARWERSCVISRLVPVADKIEPLPEGSLAAPPRSTPAANPTRKPFRLHRVRDHGARGGPR